MTVEVADNWLPLEPVSGQPLTHSYAVGIPGRLTLMRLTYLVLPL